MYDPRDLTPPEPSEREQAELEREGYAQDLATELANMLKKRVEEYELDSELEERVWYNLMLYCERNT